MKISLITPAAQSVRNGNRRTSARWGAMLRTLGHVVTVGTSWDGKSADLMLALHASRSHDSIKRFADAYPARPLIVALTGTDLYRDIRTDAKAKESLRLATRIIVLQEMGLQELARKFAEKTRVVYQSAQAINHRTPLKSCFEICVIGHLRDEKDPLRAALSLAHIPRESKIRITQLGRSLDVELSRAARALMAAEPRYHWLGEVPHWKARRYLARSKLMVISSRMEGGANVVSEALMANVPVIASRISGNIGMLGLDYPGYFPVGNERALAQLLLRAETEPAFYALLKQLCAARRKLISAAAEKRALASLLSELQKL